LDTLKDIAAAPRKQNGWPLRPTEHQIQASFFQWVRLQEAQTEEYKLMHAIPNGGAREARTGAMLKAEGVRAGVLDVCWPIQRGTFAALHIEFKRPGGKLSPEQKTWIALLQKFSAACIAVVDSVDDAIAVAKWYFEGAKC
jgi:hypothetical protein